MPFGFEVDDVVEVVWYKTGPVGQEVERHTLFLGVIQEITRYGAYVKDEKGGLAFCNFRSMRKVVFHDS